MSRKVVLSIIAASSLTALLATGCAASGGEDPAEQKALTCMVTNSGGLNDRSFNQNSWAGLEQAQERLGVDAKVLVSESASDLVPNVNTSVAEQCDLIVTVGWELLDATNAAAANNPQISFAIVDEVLDAKNVRSIVFNTSEAAFLAGYLAASVSKTGVVATFGGDKQPPVMLFMEGFYKGVAHYNEVKEQRVRVLGWNNQDHSKGLFTGDYENIANGKTLTENLLDQKADVIMPVAGQVGEGAAAAIAERGSGLVIWVDSDGYETAPAEYQKYMLTSVLKRMDQAVYQAAEDLTKGVFSNEAFIGNLENGGVDIAPFHDVSVPQTVQDELAELRKQIISGELVIESEYSPK